MNVLAASCKSESSWKVLLQALSKQVPFLRGYNLLSFIICKEAVVDHINLFQKICSFIVVGSLLRFSFLHSIIMNEMREN